MIAMRFWWLMRLIVIAAGLAALVAIVSTLPE
jgi:hypothetical protein